MSRPPASAVLPPHRRFVVEEASQIGEARRAAQVLALEQGLGEVAAGRLALVLTELGTNLVRHAGGGALLLGAPAAGVVELLSLDKGPGMDLERCLQDGFSSGGSAGQGLGAVRRAADHFTAYARPSQGCVIAVRICQDKSRRWPAPPFEVGSLTLCAPGEFVCGDAWAWRQEGLGEGSAALLVADGLGHGPQAAEAALTAVDCFKRAALLASPAALLEAAHEPMRNTRGAAVAMALLDATTGKLVFAGAGNIAGRLISGTQDRTLMSQPGTLGVQIRRLQDQPFDWPEHALLVMHSDGLATRWNFDATPELLRCEPIVIAGWLLREHCRGRDDATVVVVRRRS